MPDNRNFGQRLGFGIGRAMSDLPRWWMMLKQMQGQEEQQDWQQQYQEGILNLQSQKMGGAQNLMDTLAGSGGYERTGAPGGMGGYREPMMSMGVDPNAEPYDPMVELKLQEQRSKNEKLLVEIDNLRKKGQPKEPKEEQSLADYREYVMQTLVKGETPVPYPEFLKVYPTPRAKIEKNLAGARTRMSPAREMPGQQGFQSAPKTFQTMAEFMAWYNSPEGRAHPNREQFLAGAKKAVW